MNTDRMMFAAAPKSMAYKGVLGNMNIQGTSRYNCNFKQCRKALGGAWGQTYAPELALRPAELCYPSLGLRGQKYLEVK